ncbi:phenylalanine--tRNA ligase subunit beta [Kribbia dieselivorans]|uniref:phenylalanine--tRNA ligase subunit beta n=1 Tax=Kribbia dieselivorans TaxID=331526 RepID=UPI000838BAC7|nr:phenylalanine--tRNA ligase subunit beta [Kribbia dieselivorans]
MYAPVEWLRDLVQVDPAATGAEIAAHLVRVGLEEEDLHGGDVVGPLVVGRVLERTPEEQKNGKTINWCQVDVGDANGTGEPQGIVCGAHNFEPGDLVAVILPGGVLGGDFTITARKTYGHLSAGMICSARELGLGDDHDGIIVLTDWFAGQEDALAQLTPGTDLIPLMGLDEETVEVNVTPDRGYCFSMRGIAREYALSTGVPFTDPGAADARPVAAANDGGHAVRLSDGAPIDGRDGCDRYVARIVRGVDVNAASPTWMQSRLTASGMRPISLAVDVTNYVMLLLGQPLHAFDLDRLNGAIEVRRARAGETLTTLDDVQRTLHPEDLLITDNGETVLAIAGVMGGESSEVTETTTNVLIEAAHFDPTTVARSARRHRLATEASKRFERGVDPAVTAVAAQLAVDLLVEHGGGTVDDGVTDVGTPAHPVPFAFDTTLPTRLVGLEYPRAEVVATLEAVGCTVTDSDPTGNEVTVLPATWRPDLVDGPDLVEEVARVRGYDEIPSAVPQHQGHGLTHGQLVRRAASTTLAQHGLTEVLSYPFIGEELFDRLGYTADDERRRTVRLANPLQDEAPLMRTSLLDTLLDTLRRNVSRGARDVALFEAGLVTRGDNPTAAPTPRLNGRPDDATLDAILDSVPAQPNHIAFAAAGEVVSAGVGVIPRAYDTYDVIGWSREVGRVLGAELTVTAATLAPWHPGRCARIALPDGTLVGYAGELHPKVVAALDLPARTVVGELDLDVLTAATGAPTQARLLSTYPAANTDIALVVDESVPAAEVEAAVRSGAGGDLESLALFDIYRGDQVGEGRKSLAYRLTFRSSEKTLKTSQVTALRDDAVAAAKKATGATLRG